MFSFIGRGICTYLRSIPNNHAALRCDAAVLFPHIIPRRNHTDYQSIVYIFIGSILLSDHWTRYVAGSIIGLTGVAYTALEFVPSIEPPANMREADQGWGAEQV